MKIDLYTKSVLTVIAIALVVLCARPMLTPLSVSAQQPNPQALRVVIAGIDPDGVRDGVPVTFVAGPRAVPVTVTSIVPVVIRGAGPNITLPIPVDVVRSEPLPVEISRVAGAQVTKEGILVRAK